MEWPPARYVYQRIEIERQFIKPTLTPEEFARVLEMKLEDAKHDLERIWADEVIPWAAQIYHESRQ
jgi:hypothetical protein